MQIAQEDVTSLLALDRFGQRYRSDAALRDAVDGGDARRLLQEAGVSVPAGYDIRVVADTEDTIHVVMPPDPNADLEDETLDAVVGGGSMATPSCMGTSVTATMSSACGPAEKPE